MSSWSAENATRAYLKALKMGKGGKEPDVAEFISALAAGNNAQLMVEICTGAATSTTLALVAAAQQTGGRVICILPSFDEMSASRNLLGVYVDRVELVVGKALTEYKGADFVLVDCHVDADVDDDVLRSAKEGGGCMVVGYNAGGCKVAGLWSELKGHYLPIGDGLLVARVCGGVGGGRGWRCGGGKKSKWVVKVDKCTGEEHVFRVTSSQHKVIPISFH